MSDISTRIMNFKLLLLVFLLKNVLCQMNMNTHNYEGRHFSVGHTVCTPFIFEYEPSLDNDTIIKLAGSDIEVMKYLERALNFKAR